MATRIVFPAAKQVALETFTPAEPAAGQVRVAARVSLMSTGTENIVFNQLHEPGTHWAGWGTFPFYPGYAMIAVVEALGPDVTSLRLGQRIACRAGHASHAVLAADQCYPIPDALADEPASWFALAKIAGMGARVADLRLGVSVAVIGCGPVGQMAIRWAAAAGAGTLIAIDLSPGRLALASAGGATATIAKPISPDIHDELKALCGGDLPEIVIDSTGFPAVFSAALGAARKYGQVVLLGDTGTPSRQHLTSDVIMKGIRIVGAHDGHETSAWNSAKIVPLFAQLAVAGRFPLDGLISHRFAPADCAAAYTLVNTQRDATMGVLFDWR